MFKNKVFRNQQLKFMLFNLIAFTVIFSIFGIIIFGQVQGTLFSKTDDELLRFKQMMEEQFPGEMKLEPDRGTEFPDEPRPNDRKGFEINPRIIMLSWNESGEIVNQNQIGTLFYNNYLEDYQLEVENMDVITNITFHDEYDFRYLLFEDQNESDEIAYHQLLINIDGETAIIDHFGELLVLCSSIFVILSISASYLLSKKMMKPIIQSWNKQTEFVENASHELRTPLTIIQNKLELLLVEPDEKIMNKFENIALSLSETRRLSKLTSDLLTLARADSAETELVKQPLELDRFIKDVCAPYIEIAESQEKQMWLNLHAQAEVKGDEVRLHQLFVILLDNALKYTNEGDSIGVSTSISDHKALIEISDTGIGIKQENADKIFDRFYREDRARSRETGGVGLGLSIASWIIAKHGGTIKASQNKQKGTTFTITLPM